MKFRIEVICVSGNGTEERTKVTAIERQELAMETLGLNLAEGKSILEGLQDLLCLFTRPDRLQSLRLDQSSIMAVDLRLGTSECSSRIFLCSTISSD
jgi:hypothetical protein